MSPLPFSPLLNQILRCVARRYRLPAADSLFLPTQNAGPATALADAIEQARAAVASGDVPGPELKRRFTESLADMIRAAMHAEFGDPRFQAMVLRHRHAHVSEFAALSANADEDRRLILAAVNTIAHPAKLQRMAPGPLREALAQLHTFASAGTWQELTATARRLSDMPELAEGKSPVAIGLSRLLDSAALGCMQRLDVLASDYAVRQYRALLASDGPQAGSHKAAAQGSESQQRGKSAEALATSALEALACHLNQAEGANACYRVVTSMRVPASIPSSAEHAKSEWDAVLLRRANTPEGSPPMWDVCLFIEAKASVDAATTDLPRLRRGLRLLSHAEGHKVYPFMTKQGVVHLSGATLSALATDEGSVNSMVLYCCNADADAAPRLLSAAGRMRLLSAPASLDFASTLARMQPASSQDLEPVWQELLESSRWRSVLKQYPTLCQARELMVHTEDLLAAIKLERSKGKPDI